MRESIINGTSLWSIDEQSTERFCLSSPRSVESCLRHNLQAEDLQHRSRDEFIRDAKAAGYVADLGVMRYEAAERKRVERLLCVKKEYKIICMARFRKNVEQVLSDLSAGVERYIWEKTGIYPPEVAAELKLAIAVQGRRYLRYPPCYAKAEGEPDGGIGWNPILI